MGLAQEKADRHSLVGEAVRTSRNVEQGDPDDMERCPESPHSREVVQTRTRCWSRRTEQQQQRRLRTLWECTCVEDVECLIVMN